MSDDGTVDAGDPTVDRAEAEAFWRRCLATGAVPTRTPVPDEIFAFGDGNTMADELAELVVAGTKRATASAVADYEHAGEPLPRVGRCAVVVDGRGVPRAAIRTVEVRVGPMSTVDDDFAWDEGEGDRSRVSWLAEHEEFFRRYLPTIGVTFTADLPVVFERFEVLHAE